jgi:hypothetical protein
MIFDFTLVSGGQAAQKAVTITTGIIAGWTGRDRDAIRKHVAELEELGVKAPKATPTYYRVSVSRFTHAASIEAIGNASSGEVEFVLLKHGGKLWVGVGSDHTDREVEAYDVTVSKQMCDKPIGSVFWDFEDVAGHWEELTLTSHIVEGGERKLYQHCAVTQMLPPETLLALYRWEGQGLPDDTLMFCGTSPAIGGIRPAAQFEMTLTDPVLGRTIGHAYSIVSIPFAAETVEA